MKRWLVWIGCFMLSGCQLNSIGNGETAGPAVYNQIIFGHMDSFIANPDILFKYENNLLYTTHRQSFIDVQHPPAFSPVVASDSLMNAIKIALRSIPSAITSNTNHEIGGYFPDVGYTYLQVESGGKTQYWSLQANLPQDISPFVSTLDHLIWKIEP